MKKEDHCPRAKIQNLLEEGLLNTKAKGNNNKNKTILVSMQIALEYRLELLCGSYPGLPKVCGRAHNTYRSGQWVGNSDGSYSQNCCGSACLAEKQVT